MTVSTLRSLWVSFYAFVIMALRVWLVMVRRDQSRRPLQLRIRVPMSFVRASCTRRSRQPTSARPCLHVICSVQCCGMWLTRITHAFSGKPHPPPCHASAAQLARRPAAAWLHLCQHREWPSRTRKWREHSVAASACLLLDRFNRMANAYAGIGMRRKAIFAASLWTLTAIMPVFAPAAR